METAPEISDAEANISARLAGPWRIFWLRLCKQRIAFVGGIILGILYLMMLFAGFIAPYSFDRDDRHSFFHRPMALRIVGWHLAVQNYAQASEEAPFKAVAGETTPIKFFVRGDEFKFFGFLPSHFHLFGTGDADHPVYLLGTDQFGRDIFSRILYGSRVSLSIGLIGIIIRFALGMIVGGISGYFGGVTDSIIMRLCELIMSIPALYLIMSLRATFPANLTSTQIYFLISAILSLIGWASSARVIRGMALSLRERPFVLAARTLGQSSWRIVARHILPGTFSYVIVAATLSVPYFILGEVVLSFLGMGIQEPDASWGNMLSEAQNTEYLRNYPWLLAPGAAIFITVLAFNFLGDGLRDAADTKA